MECLHSIAPAAFQQAIIHRPEPQDDIPAWSILGRHVIHDAYRCTFCAVEERWGLGGALDQRTCPRPSTRSDEENTAGREGRLIDKTGSTWEIIPYIKEYSIDFINLINSHDTRLSLESLGCERPRVVPKK